MARLRQKKAHQLKEGLVSPLAALNYSVTNGSSCNSSRQSHFVLQNSPCTHQIQSDALPLDISHRRTKHTLTLRVSCFCYQFLDEGCVIGQALRIKFLGFVSDPAEALISVLYPTIPNQSNLRFQRSRALISSAILSRNALLNLTQPTVLTPR